ncbi:hypothetical protein LCGC14_1928380 [marine sediment metagenome]|uniref:HTH gntR-type domain-containing protein n=1 Tax=marine sediment metagenome TaxID=412755 RepID=A0A0F9FNR1_9ZZZZ
MSGKSSEPPPVDLRPGRKGGNPQSHEAYVQLLGEIRSGRLQPRMRLTETELADRLRISRTPVREALRQLEADGLVVHVPRVGATIRALEYSEVMELYEMRRVLEGTAARMAARAASDIELAELAEINDTMARAGPEDGDLRYDLNRKFHLTLLDVARNRFLSKSMSTLQKTLLILGPPTLSRTQRAAEAKVEHDAVMAALFKRDGVAAELAMQAHIEAAHRSRLRQFRDRVRPMDDP